MFKKLCTRCTRASYSSFDGGKWICPSCQNDLTHSKAFPASSKTSYSEGFAAYQTAQIQKKKGFSKSI